jgi:hypothetical protein
LVDSGTRAPLTTSPPNDGVAQVLRDRHHRMGLDGLGPQRPDHELLDVAWPQSRNMQPAGIGNLDGAVARPHLFGNGRRPRP